MKTDAKRRARKTGRGSARFVKLDHWFLNCAAWQSLKPGPRCLYLELKRHFNGSNNGEFFLSVRDAAEAVNANKDTVAAWYRVLEERGFIKKIRGGCLGPSGMGQATIYALTEEPLNGSPATREFMRWHENKNPSEKSGQPVPKIRTVGKV